jgi:hypothetical protein
VAGILTATASYISNSDTGSFASGSDVAGILTATASYISNSDTGSFASGSDVAGILSQTSSYAKSSGDGLHSGSAQVFTSLNANPLGNFTIGNNASYGATFSGNVTINEDLTVLGTTTTLESTTIEIADAFTFNASGSDGEGGYDGGMVVQSGSAALTGSAIFHDWSAGRWAVAKEVASSITGQDAISPVRHGGFVVTIKSLALGGLAPHNPANLTMTGSEHSGSYGVGEIIIDTGDDNDIWIMGS